MNTKKLCSEQLLSENVLMNESIGVVMLVRHVLALRCIVPGRCLLLRAGAISYHRFRTKQQHVLVVSSRYFHTNELLSVEGGAKSLIEKAVDRRKEKRQISLQEDAQLEIKKPSLLRRLWDGVVHTITGFRLFAKDVRLSTKLLVKSLRGQQLTRRENKLFRQTVGDIFRIVPFSVFIIVPFMEFLLPLYLYFFPGMLPTSFQRQSDKEARKKAELRMKLQMAHFLQGTLEEMAVHSKQKKKGSSIQRFSEFFQKIRTSGEQASTEDIIEFSKLFEDEVTLDNLTRDQLKALSKLLLLPAYGLSTFLRFQLRMKLRQLEADDKLIKRDGIDMLNVAELQAASQARGMRALGMPEERLRSQLQQWLDLHLENKVPTSLLLLSRAMYLPEQVGTSEALQKTLSDLPEAIVDETGIKVADMEGEMVDNKRRLEALKQLETLIEEEKVEQEKLEKEEEVDETLTREDVQKLSQAVEALKMIKEGELDEEKEVLKELQQDREEYNEDIAELGAAADDGEVLTESKASARLGRRVEGLISQVNKAIDAIKVDDISVEEESDITVTTEELAEILKAIAQVTDEEKVQRICSVMDEDHDGNISLDQLAKVVELIGVEAAGIKSDHVMQIIHLLKKEHVASQLDLSQSN